MIATRTEAILTADAVINGWCYPAGTKFTFDDPRIDGRHRLTFDLGTGKCTVLTWLNDLPYQLITTTTPTH